MRIMRMVQEHKHFHRAAYAILEAALFFESYCPRNHAANASCTCRFCLASHAILNWDRVLKALEDLPPCRVQKMEHALRVLGMAAEMERGPLQKAKVAKLVRDALGIGDDDGPLRPLHVLR